MPLIVTVLRGVLPSRLDWIADALGDLVEHLPNVIDATPGGVWSADSEAAVIALIADVLEDVPGLSAEDEEYLSVAGAIVVRLIVTSPRKPRAWRRKWGRA
jgi:hypothetical protein